MGSHPTHKECCFAFPIKLKSTDASGIDWSVDDDTSAMFMFDTDWSHPDADAELRKLIGDNDFKTLRLKLQRLLEAEKVQDLFPEHALDLAQARRLVLENLKPLGVEPRQLLEGPSYHSSLGSFWNFSASFIGAQVLRGSVQYVFEISPAVLCPISFLNALNQTETYLNDASCSSFMDSLMDSKAMQTDHRFVENPVLAERGVMVTRLTVLPDFLSMHPKILSLARWSLWSSLCKSWVASQESTVVFHSPLETAFFPPDGISLTCTDLETASIHFKAELIDLSSPQVQISVSHPDNRFSLFANRLFSQVEDIGIVVRETLYVMERVRCNV
jgi:hypothetical protein